MYSYFLKHSSLCISCLVTAIQPPAFAQTQQDTQCTLSPLMAYQQIMANADQSQQTQTSQATTTPQKNSSYSYLTNRIININTATVAELTKLPRIGAKKAQAIVDYRNAHGDFMDIDELTQVKGIGKKTVARFADKISIR